jgi:hypothetical protein
VDDTKWIAEEASIEWLRQTYRLSQGAAKAALRTAFHSGNVEVTDFINKLIEVEGKLKGIHIPATISDLVVDDYVHDLRLNFGDLRCQIEQQLGEPKKSSAQAAPRHGPKPGETGFVKARLKLLPKIKKFMRAGAPSTTAEVRQLVDSGVQIPGGGTEGTRISALVRLYRSRET